MIASRTVPMRACYAAPFWFSALCGAFLPTSTGYQDLAAFLVRQPGIAEASREHLIASPFGTIEAATISYGRPIGTAMPEPLVYQTVSFDPQASGAGSWRADQPLTARPAAEIEYPTVNRRLKGDRQPATKTAPVPTSPQSLPQLQPISATPAAPPVHSAPPAVQPAPAASPIPALHLRDAEQYDVVPPMAQPARPLPSAPRLTLHDTGHDGARHDLENSMAMRLLPSSTHDGANNALADDDGVPADTPPELPSAGETTALDAPSSIEVLSFADDPSARSKQIYFGVGAMGSPSGLERWAPGAEPVLASPAVDSGIKLSALEGAAIDIGNGGETVAKKGDGTLLESPAARLKLVGKPLARAQKCLSDAVYFEARGEPLKGQEAVAQVVMNRVFSGYYPNDVCGVVYQNANRHLACQFTFACEGKDLSKVDEPDMWEQAKRIARDTLDGKIWLAEVGHATHYHAYWVHPSWVHEMTRLYKLGVHTFYRPRAWGDGDNAPVWGKAPSAGKADGAAAKGPEAAVKSPEANAMPAKPEAAKERLAARL